jgi:hypothetical protein
MARSLRPAPWELVRDALARSVAGTLVKRNIVTDTEGKITDVKTAFSSWDNCMKASFCKYDLRLLPSVPTVVFKSTLYFPR